MNIEYWSISKQRHAARPRMTIGAKDRPALKVGDTVRTQWKSRDEWQKANVIKALPHRSYELQMGDGSIRRRTKVLTSGYHASRRQSLPTKERYHHASAASADRCSSKSIWQRSRRAPAAAAMAHGAIIIIPWPPPPPSVLV